MNEAEAMRCWAMVTGAYPNAHLTRELWLAKLSQYEFRDVRAAIDLMVDEEEFPTWAAVHKRLPVRSEYDFGNQTAVGPGALAPPPDEPDDVREAREAAFERWRQFREKHPAKPGTAGEAMDEVLRNAEVE